MPAHTPWSTLFVLLALPCTGYGQEALLRTSDGDNGPTIVITEPQTGAQFVTGESIRIRYEANPGFKGRYVEVRFDTLSRVILDAMEGQHEVEAPEPGDYEISARLLNPARARLVEDSIAVVVAPDAKESDRR